MIPKGFDSFTLGRFRFCFRVVKELTLPPFKGGVLRGALGKAIRQMSCIPQWDRPCSSCLLKGDCAYSYLFETPNTRKSDLLEGVSHAPHPFVLRPPLTSRECFACGESFETEIALIGNALGLLPRIIYALECFGGVGPTHGKLALEGVEAYTGSDWERIYTAGAEALRRLSWEIPASTIMTNADHCAVDRVELIIRTPARIKSHGSLTDSVNFTMLTKSLLRRIHLLDRWHCGGKAELDHLALIRLSEEVITEDEQLDWVDWTRHSFRQKADLKMGGLVGSVRFRGPLTAFVPYLRLGEAVHIGKGTAFGLGMYSMTLC